MSKGVKRMVGLVVAIAIPFAAPMIATAIGGSALLGGISSAIGGAVTSAFGGGAIGAGIASGIGSGLVGAGLGAANAALTGGNVGQGALMGGLGSAISGGFKGFGAAKEAANLSKAATAGGNQLVAGPVSRTAATVGPGVGPGVAGPASRTVATVAAQGAGTAAHAAAGTAARGAAQTMLGNISRSLGNVAPEILQKAAVFIASDQLSGASAQENALIQQAAARMREIEQQDKALYDTMLAEAQAINPQARGMQYYNDAQLQGIAAGEAAVEGMSPRNVDAKAEVSRRALQNASKNATLAYRQGYDSGETQRRSALGALGNMSQYNAASGILGLEQQRQADQAARAAGVRSSLGTIFTSDPGTATEDEILEGRGRGRGNAGARANAGLGGT
jgi:hypothetical protein